MSFTHKRIVPSLICLTSMAVLSAFGASANYASGIGMTANHSITIGLLATVDQAATPAGAAQDPKAQDPKKPQPVRVPKKGTNGPEAAEAFPWRAVRKDSDRDRHRHVV